MKKIAFFILLLLPIVTSAQRPQVGIIAGFKGYEGVSASAGYYFLVKNMQLGPVIDITQANSDVSGRKLVYIAPGAAVNLLFPFSKVGFAYPGMTLRYRIGDSYSGFEYGFTAGIAYQINKVMGLNFETGYRIFSVKDGKAPTGGLTDNKYTGQSVPILAGIRILL